MTLGHYTKVINRNFLILPPATISGPFNSSRGLKTRRLGQKWHGLNGRLLASLQGRVNKHLSCSAPSLLLSDNCDYKNWGLKFVSMITPNGTAMIMWFSIKYHMHWNKYEQLFQFDFTDFSFFFFVGGGVVRKKERRQKRKNNRGK